MAEWKHGHVTGRKPEFPAMLLELRGWQPILRTSASSFRCKYSGYRLLTDPSTTRRSCEGAPRPGVNQGLENSQHAN